MRAVNHSGAGATTFPSMVQYVPNRLHAKRIKIADHVFAAFSIDGDGLATETYYKRMMERWKVEGGKSLLQAYWI